MNAISSTTIESIELSNITAAVLAGGLGTRLRPVVADRPKVLAQIHGRPFLAYLLDQLSGAGLRSVVLCTGYLGDQIARTFGESYGRLRLTYSQEQQPMGTAGALRLALPHLTSDPILVINGDSFSFTDLAAFFGWYRNRPARAGILLTRVNDRDRYGSVKIDEQGAVLEFAEKTKGVNPNWISAGMYFLSEELLRSIPEDKVTSLEYDVFPRWVGQGLYGYPNEGRFLDIGTPEDFATAVSFFSGQKEMRRFVVLDRDGTIIEECEYLSDPGQIKLIPGAAAALRELQQMGFGLVVITNQSGVGRGFFDQAQLQRIHERLKQLLEKEGVHLDGLYVCPHKPDDDCFCRKPKLGLMQKASEELGFRIDKSLVVGDKPCDIDMGHLAGAITFLVRTGYGAQIAAEQNVAADYIVDDLLGAVTTIRALAGRERSELYDH
jgi:histidinol-phosphate phosphatase family protein